MKREEWMEYLEPQKEDLMETEALLWGASGNTQRGRTRIFRKKRIVLLAACILLAAFGIVAAAGKEQRNGWLSSYFNVSDGGEQELLQQMDVGAESAAEDAGWQIAATECISDGSHIYALLTVTAPEGAEFDERQYYLEGSLFKKADESLGGANFLAGGGDIEDVGRPAANQAAFLLAWELNDEIKGKTVILSVKKIAAYGGKNPVEEVVAEGNWELMLDIPEIETKTVCQWTRVKVGADTYYVYKVTVTPLGIRIHAWKAVPLSTLWKSAEYAVKKYVFRCDAAFPDGWQKEAFYDLPVTAVYQDGTTEELWTQGNSSKGFTCEKSLSFETKKLVDPAEIKELRLGDVKLQCR